MFRRRLPRSAYVALAAFLAGPHAVAPAATIRVAGPCSLADAITAANRDARAGGCTQGSGADTIDLSGDVVLSTAATPDTGLPPITSEITIVGKGFEIRRADRAPRFRIFDVRREGELTLEDVTVANGSTAASGGGIRNLGDLVLTNTTVSGNSSDSRGGGIYSDGSSYRVRAEVTLLDSMVSGNKARRGAGIAAYDYSDVILSGSTVSGNQARSRGGGVLLRDVSRAAIYNSTISANSASSGAGLRATFYSHLDILDSTISDNTSTRFEGGGIFSVGSDLRVARSLISGNSASRGGGIFTDSEYGEISVRSTTVSGNTATDAGGGLFVGGYGGSLRLTNSTISGNSAEQGGGLYALSNYYRFESEILHSTFSRNRATWGAGVYFVNAEPEYHALTASLIAGNDGGNCAGGGLHDGGANFDDDGTCPGAAAISPGIDFDSELADNGGPTPTHALFAGSVAIDAEAECFLAADQRLLSRDELCDSGSFEFGAKALGATVTGVSVGRVYCKNLTNGAKNKASSQDPSWLCSALGVSAKPPERVLLWASGSADGSGPVGGSVVGLAEGSKPKVICRNRTTGETVKFASEGFSWDCEAQGLVVAPGDSIQQKVKGEV